VTETPWSYVRLNRNQTRAGYTVVIAKRHAPELHDLSDDELCGFWRDVAAVGRAVSELYTPVKLANLSMGSRVPSAPSATNSSQEPAATEARARKRGHSTSARS